MLMNVFIYSNFFAQKLWFQNISCLLALWTFSKVNLQYWMTCLNLNKHCLFFIMQIVSRILWVVCLVTSKTYKCACTLVWLQETSEAIKSLVSCIRSITGQQIQEDNILKRLEKLDRKFQKCLNSLAEMQQRIDGDMADTSPRHPIHLKKTETEALKKQVESAKANYLDAVQYSRAMTLDHLQKTLPPLFQSLMEFSNASAQAIEAINTTGKPVE